MFRLLGPAVCESGRAFGLVRGLLLTQIERVTASVPGKQSATSLSSSIDVMGVQKQNSGFKRRELVRRLTPTWAFVGMQTRQPIAYRTADYRLVELSP